MDDLVKIKTRKPLKKIIMILILIQTHYQKEDQTEIMIDSKRKLKRLFSQFLLLLKKKMMNNLMRK